MSVSGEVVSIRRGSEHPEPVEFKWSEENRAAGIPDWVYTRYDEPASVEHAEAECCYLNHVISDIDLQIEMNKVKLDLDRSQENIETHRAWKIKTLKAKQNNTFILCAYKYWLCLNKNQTTHNSKLDMLLELLAEDPVDFTDRVIELKNL